jgi:hypothetical protein
MSFQPTCSHPHVTLMSLLLHSLHLVLFLMQGSISSLLVGQHPEVLSQTPMNNSRFTWQNTLCHGSQKNCHYCQAKRKSTQVISSKFVLQLATWKVRKTEKPVWSTCPPCRLSDRLWVYKSSGVNVACHMRQKLSKLGTISRIILRFVEIYPT